MKTRPPFYLYLSFVVTVRIRNTLSFLYQSWSPPVLVPTKRTVIKAHVKHNRGRKNKNESFLFSFPHACLSFSTPRRRAKKNQNLFFEIVVNDPWSLTHELSDFYRLGRVMLAAIECSWSFLTHSVPISQISGLFPFYLRLSLQSPTVLWINATSQSLVDKWTFLGRPSGVVD